MVICTIYCQEHDSLFTFNPSFRLLLQPSDATQNNTPHENFHSISCLVSPFPFSVHSQSQGCVSLQFSSVSMNQSYRNASASSSSSLSSQDTEDDQAIASILAEEENLKTGNRLGKRLSHLDSIPHTPRVNGEIPDVNYATLDHQRLAERLATYDLAEFQIEGDGNCQFRALADQLFRNPDYHKHVRKQVKKQLRHNRKLYEAYVPMKYRSYVRKMKKSGEWGDHVTLQAAADRFGVKICLITSFRDTCYIEILPKQGNPTREVWLSFWCEVHYNSLYATADLPARIHKKKHWLF